MRISDWSSDVCSSDLIEKIGVPAAALEAARIFGVDVDIVIECKGEPGGRGELVVAAVIAEIVERTDAKRAALAAIEVEHQVLGFMGITGTEIQGHQRGDIEIQRNRKEELR